MLWAHMENNELAADLAPGQATVWSCTDQEYYGSGAVGSSSLKTFVDSPEQYYREHIEGQSASSGYQRALYVGQAIHLHLLEPEEVDRILVKPPKIHWSTFFREFPEDGNSVFLNDADATMALDCADTVLEDDYLKYLIDDHPYEVEAPHHGTEVAGLMRYSEDVIIRCKWDINHATGFRDIKTTTFDGTPPMWFGHFLRWGYQWQVGLYALIWQTIWKRLPEVSFIVVPKPHYKTGSFACPPFNLVVPPESVAVCVQQVREKLDELQACYDNEVWSAALPPGDAHYDYLMPRFGMESFST